MFFIEKGNVLWANKLYQLLKIKKKWFVNAQAWPFDPKTGIPSVLTWLAYKSPDVIKSGVRCLSCVST